ncbi:hypothetical protein CCUG62472_00546 [Mycobacteroides salmoniphilum]|nr:hypothetical protein CCUG62472_00546 [Mycobacteroides salmoniphilum]
MFGINKHIAGHARGKRQLLLRQALPQALMTNPGPHLLPDLLPLRDTLGVVLAGSRGHAPQ